MNEDKADVIVLGEDYDEDEYEIIYKCLRDKDGHRRYVFNVKRIEENKVMYCDRNICIENEYNGTQCDECKVTKSQRGGERMKINIAPQNLGLLCICAIRYCHGRQTYMPGKILGIAGGLLRHLSDKDIGVMLNDCDYQERSGLYGDEAIDKPGWIEWRKRLKAEKERREK